MLKPKRSIVRSSSCHNPNVVVSADAENIIVANQHGTNSPNRDSLRFQYTNGALEDTMPNKKPEPEQYIVLESQGIRELMFAKF